MNDQLIDALLADRTTRSCSFKTRREEMLTPEQNEALTFAIRNTAKPIREIVSILQSIGMPVSRDTITLHRKGLCPLCRATT